MAMSQNFAVERCEAFSIQRLMGRSVKIAYSASAQWPLYAVLVWSAMPETRQYSVKDVEVNTASLSLRIVMRRVT